MEDRETRLKRLLDKASRLTRDPGVYLMKDKEGRVIYVGKSAALRDRVSSYFQRRPSWNSAKCPCSTSSKTSTSWAPKPKSKPC